MTELPLRALVAEDDPVIRMLMVETLEDDGYEVLEAGDGAEAFRMMAGRDAVQLIVTDYHMPGFSGVDVAKRARESQPTIPVLFVSARPDVLANAGAPEPYAALGKPFTLAQLSAAVHRLMDEGAG